MRYDALHLAAMVTSPRVGQSTEVAGPGIRSVRGECGDVECGAITAALEVGPDRITWSHLNGYDPIEPIEFAPAAIPSETADCEVALASKQSGHCTSLR